ncbi:hypothetical protein ABFX02_06G131300 [Erythranthe guttata]
MTTRRPPKWLPLWLNLKFYQENCKKHVSKYCTRYCGVCMCEPFCDTCWKEKSKEHENHDQILKVCSASDRAAIKKSDMEKYWDVSDIQRYKINGKGPNCNFEDLANNWIQLPLLPYFGILATIT